MDRNGIQKSLVPPFGPPDAAVKGVIYCRHGPEHVGYMVVCMIGAAKAFHSALNPTHGWIYHQSSHLLGGATPTLREDNWTNDRLRSVDGAGSMLLGGLHCCLC